MDSRTNFVCCRWNNISTFAVDNSISLFESAECVRYFFLLSIILFRIILFDFHKKNIFGNKYVFIGILAGLNHELRVDPIVRLSELVHKLISETIVEKCR